jgi:hypothetical protein
MVDVSTTTTSKICRSSDKIMMALVSSSRPEAAIFRMYEEAEDKAVFVAGLIGCFILKHRQWQTRGMTDAEGAA